jgi:SAM-dependent methyltransferase
MAKAKTVKKVKPVATPVVFPTNLKLDLGCGKNKQPGYLGVDRRKFEGVDAVTDLTGIGKWEFDRDFIVTHFGEDYWTSGNNTLPDSCVEAAHCSHFLEHLNHNSASPQRVRFMNELYRVLIPGGTATVITPHWASNRAYGDFTHADKPVSEMFYYYVSKEWRSVNAPDNDIEWNEDGYSCDFEATWGYSLHPEIQVRNQTQQTFALTFYKESAQDLHATLKAKK